LEKSGDPESKSAMLPLDLTWKTFITGLCSQTEIDASKKDSILSSKSTPFIRIIVLNLDKMIKGQDITEPLSVTAANLILLDLLIVDSNQETIEMNASKIPSKFIHNLIWIACCAGGRPVEDFKKWMAFWEQLNNGAFSFHLPQTVDPINNS
jgi:hypothetical protein